MLAHERDAPRRRPPPPDDRQVVGAARAAGQPLPDDRVVVDEHDPDQSRRDLQPDGGADPGRRTHVQAGAGSAVRLSVHAARPPGAGSRGVEARPSSATSSTRRVPSGTR